MISAIKLNSFGQTMFPCACTKYYLISILLHSTKPSIWKQGMLRVMEFNDFHPNIELMGIAIDSFPVRSHLSCAIFCLYREKCRSFNFCPEFGICELNKYTIHDYLVDSLRNTDDDRVKNSSKCANTGLSADSLLVNSNNWRTGSAYELHDYNWTVEIDDETELKEARHRQCRSLDGTQVSNSFCSGNALELQWLRWFSKDSDKLTWHKARDRCSNVGGELFGDPYSSVFVQFVFERVNGPFWMGIYKRVNETRFWNIHGKDVTRYVSTKPWPKNESIAEEYEYAFGRKAGSNFVVVSTTWSDAELKFFCQMDV